MRPQSMPWEHGASAYQSAYFPTLLGWVLSCPGTLGSFSSMSSSSNCCWPPAPAGAWAQTEGLPCSLRHLRLAAPWGVPWQLVGGRRPLTYCWSRYPAYSSMEAALLSGIPHPPWVPTGGRPRGRGDTWHDFLTSCQDMCQSSGWWEGKPSNQWMVCVFSHRMGPCENQHLLGKCPHAWGHETLNSK